MSNYRICLMSGGLVKAEYNFECETDGYALTQAQSMLGEYARAEVWIGTRQVGALEVDMRMARSRRWDDLDSSLSSWRH